MYQCEILFHPFCDICDITITVFYHAISRFCTLYSMVKNLANVFHYNNGMLNLHSSRVPISLKCLNTGTDFSRTLVLDY